MCILVSILHIRVFAYVHVSLPVVLADVLFYRAVSPLRRDRSLVNVQLLSLWIHMGRPVVNTVWIDVRP